MYKRFISDISYYAQFQKEVTNLDEIIVNCTEMNRVNKTYNRLTIIYAALYLPYSLLCLFSGFMIPSVNILAVFLDTLILKAGVIACGFLACYRHKNNFAIYSVLLQVISAICGFMEDTFLDMLIGSQTTGLGFNKILLILSIVCCIITIRTNKKYEYLETQPGFPHFNERRLNQEFDKKQREIKDEFQQNYERIIKNSSDHMTDVDMNSRDTFPATKHTPEYDYEHAHDEPEKMDTI